MLHDFQSSEQSSLKLLSSAMTKTFSVAMGEGKKELIWLLRCPNNSYPRYFNIILVKTTIP